MIRRDGDTAAVTVPMVLANAAGLLEAGRRELRSAARVFDFSAVNEVDSSGLAVLFGWLREARSAGCAISFANLPQNLQSLAAVYDVVELLPTA